VIELQDSGACYYWRLPYSRWLGGGIRRSTQEACAVLQRRDYEGYHALVERVIELPSLVGRFLRCPTCGLGG
jgi:hypothetical protein